MQNQFVSRIIEVAFHRNGISGAPFHVVNFIDTEDHRKVGILFDDDFHCAVLDIDLLNDNVIAFIKNSWRGDRYEPELREAIEEHRKSL